MRYSTSSSHFYVFASLTRRGIILYIRELTQHPSFKPNLFRSGIHKIEEWFSATSSEDTKSKRTRPPVVRGRTGLKMSGTMVHPVRDTLSIQGPKMISRNFWKRPTKKGSRSGHRGRDTPNRHKLSPTTETSVLPVAASLLSCAATTTTNGTSST